MLTKTFLFIIISLFFFSIKSTQEGSVETNEDQPPPQDPKILAFESHAKALIDNFAYLFPKYIYNYPEFDEENPSGVDSSIFWRTVSFYNQNANEHMFTLVISFEQKSKITKILIRDTKVNDILLTLGDMNWNMFQYQLPQYQAFLSQALKYKPFWKKKEMAFNTIEKVSELLNKAFSALEFNDITYVEGNNLPSQFQYQLKSKENYIGVISLYIEESLEEDTLVKMSLEKNYLLNINVNVLVDNQLQNVTYKVPVIDNGGFKLKQIINDISKYVDMKNQFNNQEELVGIIKQYYKTRIPDMKWEEPQTPKGFANFSQTQGNEVQSNAVYYWVQLEYTKKQLMIDSKFNDQGLMEYIFQVSDNFGMFYTPALSVHLLRSSEKVVNSILDQNKADKFFKTIYDDIMDMFETKYSEIRQKIKKGKSKKDWGGLVGYVETNNMFQRNGKGKQNKEFKIHFAEKKKDKKDYAYVELTASSVSFDFQKTFYMESYNHQLMFDFIELFFKSYMDLVEE